MSLPYRIERTRNRHSRAVFQGDHIIIRLARNLSQREEERHVESLLRRMRKMALRELARPRIDPFAPLLEGHAELQLPLTTGRIVAFRLRPGSRTAARHGKDGWEVTVGAGTRRRALNRFLWRLLARAIQSDAEEYVAQMNAATLNVRVRSVRLRAMTSQWGSCSSNGDIALNTALFVLPKALLDYVVIHELAHRIVRGHTAAFWRVVEAACPDADEARKELREHRISGL